LSPVSGPPCSTGSRCARRPACRCCCTLGAARPQSGFCDQFTCDARLTAAGGSPRHRDVWGGCRRPPVLGAVEGLVTNASLIPGLGGGDAPPHAIILTGVAALVAGAFSMGTGEYVSGTNQ